MKKFVKYVFVCLTALTLVGCGKDAVADPGGSVTLEWDGYTLSFDGKPLAISEHRGNNVIVNSDVGTNGGYYNMALDISKDVTNLTINNQGIPEEEMSKLKDMFYYTQYNNTVMTAAYNLGGEYWATVQSNVSAAVPLMAEAMYNYLTTIPFTDKTLYVDCGGKFTFGSEWYNTIARPGKILVTDVIQVLPGQVHPQMEPYTFYKEDGTSVQGMVASTDAYDYYYYEGFTIQCAKGASYSDFIKFK